MKAVLKFGASVNFKASIHFFLINSFLGNLQFHCIEIQMRILF